MALWAQGQPVLSWDFLKPFGIVVAAVVGVAGAFNRWAWSWRVFRGWYVNLPDLRGTWRTVLTSDWIDPATGHPIAPIDGFVVIRQTLSHLSVRLMTKESRSRSIAYSITKEDDDVFRLAVVYRNEPEIELQGNRSEIHHGAFWLEIFGDEPHELKGHYWTDRKTRGGMHCTDRSRKYCTTYVDAASHLGTEKTTEQSGEREPPMTPVLKSWFLGGGPVTAVVSHQRGLHSFNDSRGLCNS